MKRQNKNKKPFSGLKWSVLILLLVVGTVLLVLYAPQIKQLLTSHQTIQRLNEWIASIGGWGIPVLLILQVAQVFIAIIPSEPIEITAGICYGGFWGFFLCITGVGLGSLFVFLLIKRYGPAFVEKLTGKKELKEFGFLKKKERLEGVAFLLYFIPGLPKDIFTYFAALTPMSTKNFLLISLTARIPSVLVSTIAGQQYMEGNYKATALIFLIFAAIGIMGMIGYRLIANRLNRRSAEGENDSNDGK